MSYIKSWKLNSRHLLFDMRSQLTWQLSSVPHLFWCIFVVILQTLSVYNCLPLQECVWRPSLVGVSLRQAVSVPIHCQEWGENLLSWFNLSWFNATASLVVCFKLIWWNILSLLSMFNATAILVVCVKQMLMAFDRIKFGQLFELKQFLSLINATSILVVCFNKCSLHMMEYIIISIFVLYYSHIGWLSWTNDSIKTIQLLHELQSKIGCNQVADTAFFRWLRLANTRSSSPTRVMSTPSSKIKQMSSSRSSGTWSMTDM